MLFFVEGSEAILCHRLNKLLILANKLALSNNRPKTKLINSLQLEVAYLYPLKTSENLKVF